MELTEHDIHLQMVNISWTPLDVPSNQNYTLRVTSMNTQPQVYQLPVSSFMFKAPKGAPPCEVYNFSVSATYMYVGATYTGVDCSLHSQVFSRMLPSLPDIVRLNSSLNYSLERQRSGATTMTISILVSNNCTVFQYWNFIFNNHGSLIPKAHHGQFLLWRVSCHKVHSGHWKPIEPIRDTVTFITSWWVSSGKNKKPIRR